MTFKTVLVAAIDISSKQIHKIEQRTADLKCCMNDTTDVLKEERELLVLKYEDLEIDRDSGPHRGNMRIWGPLSRLKIKQQTYLQHLFPK